MIFRLVICILLFINPLSSYGCPTDCYCNNSDPDRKLTICNQGNLNVIPIKDFDDDVQEIVIDGSHNYLTIGPIFDGLRKLRVLRILNAQVPAIGRHSFLGCTNLRILDLSHNNISTVTEDNFLGLTDLLELNLSHNKIDRIPSGSFRRLTSLRVLILSNNFIEELVPRQFLKLQRLKSLDLSGNYLTELPVDIFKDTKFLNTLKCRHCRLSELNHHLFDVLSLLYELDMGYNRITKLTGSEFKNLTKLNVLKLDGNRIKALNNFVLQNQKSLSSLDISHNDIKNISTDAFRGLRNLIELDLSYNSLTSLNPESVDSLVNLNVLSLSGNTQLNLTTLHQTFKVLEMLEMLSISGMYSDFPDDIFKQLAGLKVLNVSDNNLYTESLNAIQNVAETLEVLDLSNNKMKGITRQFILKLQHCKIVILENNPLHCDQCHIGPLLEYSKSVKWESFPKCQIPDDLRGVAVNELDASILEWCITDGGESTGTGNEVYYSKASVFDESLIGAYAIGVLIIIIIIFVTICVYSKHSAKYYTHEDQLTDDKNGIDFEKIDVSGHEINFKFPHLKEEV